MRRGGTTDYNQFFDEEGAPDAEAGAEEPEAEEETELDDEEPEDLSEEAKAAVNREKSRQGRERAALRQALAQNGLAYENGQLVTRNAMVAAGLIGLTPAQLSAQAAQLPAEQ